MSEPAVQETTEEPSAGRPDGGGCSGGCKPHLVHWQRCKTESVAKQAEYNARTQPEIDAAHVTYNTTRKDDRTHLDDAAYAELVARVTTYQEQVDEAKACFTSLVGEPAALVQRVTDAKAEIDAALTADPAKTDLKRVYAQALVARRHIRLIWNGFEQSKDFVECLCTALNCWSTGNAAVSMLTGKRAFEDCMRAARTAQCTELQTNIVDEILAWYEKRCPPPDCDDSKPVDPDCPPKKAPPKPPDRGYEPEPERGYEKPGYEPERGYEGEPERERGYGPGRERGYGPGRGAQR